MKSIDCIIDSFLFLIKLDRVKVVNGLCATSSCNDTEHAHLLNILNWSPMQSLNIRKSATVEDSTVKNDNESKSKTIYNTVQISIELQKKMLK